MSKVTENMSPRVQYLDVTDSYSELKKITLLGLNQPGFCEVVVIDESDFSRLLPKESVNYRFTKYSFKMHF